jgi:hypothetical protein
MGDLFDFAADASIDRVLCVVNECHVYKIPPRSSAQGHRANDWNGHHLWTGRCRVIAKGSQCEIKLEDSSSGKLFATCPINCDADAPPSVEPVLDSSRYFVLRIEDGSGKHAFIGLGFTDRSHAFDFNAALQDFRRDLNSEKERAAAPPAAEGPKLDLSLKEGQTIKVKIAGRTGSAKKPASGGEVGDFSLAPPPANPASAGAAAATAAAQDFSGFGDFTAAPAQSPSGAAAADDEWTSFDD